MVYSGNCLQDNTISGTVLWLIFIYPSQWFMVSTGQMSGRQQQAFSLLCIEQSSSKALDGSSVFLNLEGATTACWIWGKPKLRISSELHVTWPPFLMSNVSEVPATGFSFFANKLNSHVQGLENPLMNLVKSLQVSWISFSWSFISDINRTF